MVEEIFYGSVNIIKKPIYGYGKPYNDYGLGFYCAKDKELAKEWAVNQDNDGFCNIYNLNMDGLNVLYLNDKKYCVLSWLALLLKNRFFDIVNPLAKEAKEYIR